MLKQKWRMIARVVYLVDLGLTSVAFFAAFWIRALLLPVFAPNRFPTGLFPLQDYLKIYPVVLIIWSQLLFSYHSYHRRRTRTLQQEVLTDVRVGTAGNV